MYVCICNAIRDREVRRAIHEHGATSPGRIYKCLNVTPCCGKCGQTMREMVQAERMAMGAAAD